MLSLLHIENIALIESADIRFGGGFNALTGETGAGKSIVIDSISAVLGERTSRDLIRTGAKSAYVSALFCALPELDWKALTGFAPDEQGELLLEREIQADGRNVCRVNGRPLTVTQLRGVGRQLLNIHGQHDGQQLLNEEYHLDYLDRFGNLEAPVADYQSCYREYTALRQEIQSLQMDEAEKSRRVDTLTYQIQELERAALQPGEDVELAAKKTLLRNAGKLMSALETLEYALDGGDGSEGAVGLLSDAAGAAMQAARCVPDGGERGDTLNLLSQRLNQLQSEAYDVLETARDLREELDVSPQEIDRMEHRLDQLYRLGKKYGSTVEEMLDYLERCKDELDRIQYSEDRIARLEQKLARAENLARHQGGLLTEARREAGGRLQARIQTELADLDMPKVRFRVEIAPLGGAVGMEHSGMDRICFLMSANVGEDLKPIHHIASGGELARIMLALKNVLAESDDVSSLVFDEVDTGVSGRAAVKVARKLAQVARQKQILCVTHLPQIAAMADTHFFIRKGEKSGRTYTRITELDRTGRGEELARLTGGEAVSRAMLDSAEELLCESESFKAALSKAEA